MNEWNVNEWMNEGMNERNVYIKKWMNVMNEMNDLNEMNEMNEARKSNSPFWK